LTQSRHWSTSNFTMTESQNIPWKRITVESAAIVASILLAFAIEAWWEARQANQQRLGHVTALDRDFRQMAVRAQASFDNADRAAVAGNHLLSLIAHEAEPSADVARMSIVSLGMYEVFSPSVGAYDAIVSSGDIELLKISDLKRELAAFFGSFEDMRVSERLLVDLQARFLESDDYVRLIGLHRHGPFGLPSVGEIQVNGWADSDHFLNSLAHLTLRQMDVSDDYLFLLERIDVIRVAIAAESELD
jgi:hypothetical protein